jgi:DMSO/TMAO reductase YedYZ molybdopterin-dependent catalytic subunit
MSDPIDVRPADPSRLPPGQVVTTKWPVLHYSHVPRIAPADWTFRVWGAVERPVTIDWAQLERMPRRDVLCDMHCVTQWSRFDNRFAGVSVPDVLALARPSASATHVLVHADPDYTTNLPLADLTAPGSLLATHWNHEPLSAEHGGPVRLLVPHLYLWKSAKWVRGFELLPDDWPGFWEQNGYHMRGDPWREERYGRPDPVRMRRGKPR